jgi:hypothetical protein
LLLLSRGISKAADQSLGIHQACILLQEKGAHDMSFSTMALGTANLHRENVVHYFTSSTGYWRGAVPWQGSSSFCYAGVGIAIYRQMKDTIESVLVQFMALYITAWYQ